MPVISMADDSKIFLADYAVLCSDSRYTDLGINHPIVLRTLNHGAEIIIGENTGISGGSICASQKVEIGSDCLIGANVTITDTDFHPIQPNGRRFNNKPEDIKSGAIKISNNVFLGMNSVILKGVVIGKNSVIGANSTVTCSIPDNEIWAGSPAKLLDHIND